MRQRAVPGDRHPAIARAVSLPELAGTRVPDMAAVVGGRGLHDLQQLAGNAAVGILLQRQQMAGATATIDSPTATPTPLNPAQVTDALTFYHRRPALYTPQVIAEMRARLRLGPGGVDEALVHAVARFQQYEGSTFPELKIDGKAGPNTAPRLFPTGLAEPAEGLRFGGDAQDTAFDQWATLGTAQARAVALVDAVNTRLTAAGVPDVAWILGREGPIDLSSFDVSTWLMTLEPSPLEKSALTAGAAAELADSVYHEARHAEEAFQQAQLLAGQGRSAAQIAKRMGIPDRIATAATASPIQPGTPEALVAAGWYESAHGTDAAHNRRVRDRVDASGLDVKRAKHRLAKEESPANQTRYDRAADRYLADHERYRELPDENDAWATGKLVGIGITGTPTPSGDEHDE